MLDYIVLGMLLDEDLTGYALRQRIEAGIGVFYKASYGSLYPTLARLTDKGLLSMREAPCGGRRRKLYRATDTGQAAFLDWLVLPMAVLEGATPHLAKVFFFDRLPAGVRDARLAEYESNNAAYLRKLETLAAHYRARDCHDYYYKLSTLYYGICVTQETLRWCRHIRAGHPLAELIREEITNA